MRSRVLDKVACQMHYEARLPSILLGSGILPGFVAFEANAKRQKSFEKLVHMEEQRRRRYLDKMRAEYGADYRMSIC
eukprot:6385260-Amphidinium_carterae.1